MNRMMAPFAAPTKAAGLQGKKPQGSGGPCLWGQQWTRLAPQAQQVLATTGHGPRPLARRRPALPQSSRMMAPLCGPHKSGGFAGEKAARVRGVQIDLGEDAEDADHLITPEERLRVAMARQ